MIALAVLVVVAALALAILAVLAHKEDGSLPDAVVTLAVVLFAAVVMACSLVGPTIGAGGVQ